MKKQTFIFILIGLIIIAIIGLGVYYFYVKKPAADRIKSDQTINESLNVKNISDCDNFTDKTVQNNCRQSFVIKQAASSGDLGKCTAITDKALAADCSAQASFSLAIQKKDKKYCDNIINKTDKENCLKVLAEMGIK